ncbi:MAG TPA: AraC family transcriptional regulator, partial [Bacilli bacterium]
MYRTNLGDLSPIISAHIYWEQKRHFQFKEDRYDSWVVFVVEKGEFRYEIGSQTGFASFGELVFCPPNTWFRREIVNPLTFHFILFSWKTPHPIHTCDWMPVGKISVNDHKRLISTYHYLRKLALLNDQQSVEWKNHLLFDIL